MALVDHDRHIHCKPDGLTPCLFYTLPCLCCHRCFPCCCCFCRCWCCCCQAGHRTHGSLNRQRTHRQTFSGRCEPQCCTAAAVCVVILPALQLRLLPACHGSCRVSWLHAQTTASLPKALSQSLLSKALAHGMTVSVYIFHGVAYLLLHSGYGSQS